MQIDKWLQDDIFSEIAETLEICIVDIPLNVLQMKPTVLINFDFNLTSKSLSGVVQLKIMRKPMFEYENQGNKK